MDNTPQVFGGQTAFREQQNPDANCYIENIFVFGTTGGMLLPFTASMQVEEANVLERLHQGLAHLAMCYSVRINIVGDETKCSDASSLELMLAEANEFNEVVVKVGQP